MQQYNTNQIIIFPLKISLADTPAEQSCPNRESGSSASADLNLLLCIQQNEK
jgi:hypothetical protein